MKYFALIFLFAINIALCADHIGFRLEGSIRNHNGTALPRADAFVFRYGETTPIATTLADTNGAFQLHIDSLGVYRIVLSGVGCAPFDAPLLVVRSMNIRVAAQLASYEYVDPIDSVRIIGDFNKFSFSGAKTMTKLPSGIFSITIPTTADTFAYQVLGVERSGRSINGAMSDRYVSDGTGDYRSVVSVHGGSATVTFDPRTLSTPTGVAAVAWKPTAINHWMHTQGLLSEIRSNYQHAIAPAQGNPEIMIREAMQPIHVLDSMIVAEKQPLVRQLIMVEYIEFGVAGLMTGKMISDTNIVSRALNEIAPTAEIWSINPGVVVIAAAMLNMSDRAKQYMQNVVDHHATDDVKAQVLLNAIQFLFFKNLKEDAVTYYDRLQTDYPQSSWAATAKTQYSPTRRVMTGKPAPQFSVSSIDDSTTVFTNASLRGKYVLIDFWATWCGPCVAEMARLHEAYKTYHPHNFEILSLSFDKSPSDVNTFRKATWPMPWLHGFAQGSFGGVLADSFEAKMIPKPVLIDPAGNILATDMELRGMRLEETLRKFIPY